MICVPAFQPIKNVRTQSFAAAEVLARWYVEGQVLTPCSLPTPPHWELVDLEVAEFIQHNLRYCMSRYSTLFLNISEQTLSSDASFKSWAKVIQSIAMNHPSRLVIEITEGIQHSSLLLRWEALKAMNVSLALDDFGEQNSSMERLICFNWNYCKLDVRKLRSQENCLAIYHCRRKGIQLIVEQVGTFDLAERAKLLGLLFQQGFYHAEPDFMELNLNNSEVFS